MKLLIDTHILIWVLENNKALSKHHKSLISDVRNEKIVSQVSFMELAIKINIAKLTEFKMTLEDFIRQTQKDGFIILPISDAHITAYTSLPFVSNHRDPFDRFLITVAKEENMSLITADEKLKAYNHLVPIL